MAILASSVQPPTSPVARTYVPTSGSKYKVQDGDSWTSLAAAKGLSPWDLIQYNYPGLPADRKQASNQVNWYLQEYVGCTAVTPSRKNYRFSSSASPGEIWLPLRAPAAPLTPNQIAKNVVLATLREPLVSMMNFGVGRIFIPSSQYAWLAKAIDRDYITVQEDPALSGSAVYHYGANRIDVPPYGGAPSLEARALIIHECTHAIFDLRKVTSPVEESEGIAYVAQALYSRLNGSTHRHVVSADPADVVSWMAWQSIFDEAAKLAEMVSRKFKVTEQEAGLLFWAIKNANFYRGRVGSSEMFDGVADAFYFEE